MQHTLGFDDDAPITGTIKVTELQQVHDFLRRRLFNFASNDVMFNLYRGRNKDLDVFGAGKRRRNNLQLYLSSFTKKPDVLVVGDHMAAMNARFSGVPFLSENQVMSRAFGVRGERTSQLPRPAKDRTSTLLWNLMEPYRDRMMLWNAMPFHCHPEDDALKNRQPTRKELHEAQPILRGVVEALQPRCVIAIGKSAYWSLQQMGFLFHAVKHPSFGATEKFMHGIEDAMGVKPTTNSRPSQQGLFE